MTAVEDPETGRADYDYNGLGFRTSMVSDNAGVVAKTEYLIDITRDAFNLLEMTVDGEKESFVYDRNVVSMKQHRGGSRVSSFYLQDELGSMMRMTGTDGYAYDAYAYDEFGRDITSYDRKEAGKDYIKEGNLIQPFAFTGYQTDNISGMYFAQARSYDPITGRFNGKDIKPGSAMLPDSLNRYVYCLSNPIQLVDVNGKCPEGDEGSEDNSVVVSGGTAQSDDFSYQFIETGLHDIHEQIDAGVSADDITWMIVNAGYKDTDIEHFQETGDNLGVNVVIIDDKYDFIDFINNTDSDDPITRMSFFCHGQCPRYSHSAENQLSFAYNVDPDTLDGRTVEDINFTQSDISSLDSSVFADDMHTYFFSCNAGTDDFTGDNSSFAQNWSNQTGGYSYGIRNGRTFYGAINSVGSFGFHIGSFTAVPGDYVNGALDIFGKASSEWTDKKDRSDERKEHADGNGNVYGYSEAGSLNYPCMVSLSGDMDTLDGGVFDRGFREFCAE